MIGCFTVRLKVELCSDWLFYSAEHFSSSHIRKETQGKCIFQYFLVQLYCWVIILDIKCWHQGVTIKGIVLPKIKNSVIIYSPSSSSKPVLISCSAEHKGRYFEESL